MKVSSVRLGYLEENCYLLENGCECLLIDPGEELFKILDFIRDKNIIGILITHRHFDHVDSLGELVSRYHYPVYDYHNLREGNNKIGSFSFEAIYTPGHTSDSMCYYFMSDKVMFTGDFLFKGSIGRCDLGGNEEDMVNSIDKIKKYDDDIVIYPGHGESSILLYEKKYNPYLG